MEKTGNRKTGKRLLSYVLTLALIVSMLVIGNVSVQAGLSKTATKTLVRTVSAFAVPEVIYLKPAGTPSAFQYYVNSTLSGGFDTALATEGKIFFNTGIASGVSNVRISFSGASAITLGGSSRNAGTEVALTENASAAAMTIGGGTFSLAQGSQGYITWTIKFTYDGVDYISKAVTCVYSPKLQIGGQGASYENLDGFDSALTTTAFITGTHYYQGGNKTSRFTNASTTVTTNNSTSNGGNTSANPLWLLENSHWSTNAKGTGNMPGGSVSSDTYIGDRANAVNQRMDSYYTNTSGGGMYKSGHRSTDTGSQTISMGVGWAFTSWDNSPIMTLFVDRAYAGANNWSKIPQLYAGQMMHYQGENTSFGGRQDHTNLKLVNIHNLTSTNNTDGDKDMSDNAIWIQNASTWSADLCNLQTDGCYYVNRFSGTVPTATTTYKMAHWIYENDGSTTNSYWHYRLRTVVIDKGTLRTRYKNQIKNFYASDLCTTATVTAHENRMKAAGERLTDLAYPTYSSSITATAIPAAIQADVNTQATNMNTTSTASLVAATGAATAKHINRANNAAIQTETMNYSYGETVTATRNTGTVNSGTTGGVTVDTTVNYSNTYNYVNHTPPGGTSTTNISSNVTLVKQSTRIWNFYYNPIFNVVYNSDGGSYTPTSHTNVEWGVSSGTTPVAASNPTKAGYTFAGWKISGSGNTAAPKNDDIIQAGYAINKLTNTPGTVTLTAQWKPNTYNLHFNFNGGKYGSYDPVEVFELVYDGLHYNSTREFFSEGTTNMPTGAGVDSPVVMPVKTGYTMLGWTKTQNGTDYVGAQHPNDAFTGNDYTAKFFADSMGLTGPQADYASALEIKYPFTLGENGNGVIVNYPGGYTAYEGSDAANTHIGMTLYAKWQANTYTVNYHKNSDDATGTVASSGHTYDEPKNLNSNAFSLVGQTFLGWTEDPNGTGTLYTDGQSVKNLTSTANGVVDLYAKWGTNAYTVKFHSNDGNDATETQLFAYGTPQNLRLNSFTRAGYDFLGWSTNSTATAAQYADGAEVNNLTAVSGGTVDLYAVWKAVAYKIAFDLQGGNVNDNPADIVQTANYDAQMNLPTYNPRKTGYNFAGWWTEIGGTGTQIAAAFTVDNTILSPTSMGNPDVATKLYAHWTAETYEIIWSLEGGTIDDSSDDPQTNVTYGGYYSTPQGVLERPDYVFLGWYTTKVTGGAEIDQTVVVDDTTLSADTIKYESVPTFFYARWRYDSEYKLRYNLQGGKVDNTNAGPISYAAEIGDTLVIDDTAGNIPEDPVRTGYVFGGWWSNTDGTGTEIEAGDVLDVTMLSSAAVDDPTETTEYYAHWIVNEYDVEFVPNGGTIPGVTGNGQLTLEYDEFYTLPTPPEREGYAFAGWFTRGSDPVEITNTVQATNLTLDPSILSGSGTAAYFDAKWVAIKYAVAFQPDGGLIGGSSNSVNKEVSYGAVYGLPAEPMKTGYTFEGWWTMDGATEILSTTVADSNTLSAATMLSPTTATEFIAHWAPITYLVTFNPTGGTMTGTTTSVTYDSTYGAGTNGWPGAGTWDEPELAGYTFGGWFTQEGGAGTKIESGTTVKITGPQTLYAHWVPVGYTVEFDANGGTPAAQTKTVSYNAFFELPAVPVKTGYAFTGWNTEHDGSGTAIDATVRAAEPILNVRNTPYAATFYAQWTPKKYTITFNADGGTPNEQDFTDLTYGVAAVPVPTEPTKAGFAFGGWYTEQNGGGTQLDDTALVVNDSVLSAASLANNGTATVYYANWTSKSYKVVFDANDGKFADASTAKDATVAFGGTYTLPEEPKRTGYTFGGWYTATSGGDQILNTTVASSENLNPAAADGETAATFYAKWNAELYSIIFDADGGDSDATLSNLSYDQTLVLPASPVKLGYTFSGWYTAKNGGGTQLNATTVGEALSSASLANPATATTYYAKWSPRSYHVEYNPQGGNFSGNTANAQTTVDYNAFYSLPANPTKAGYTFLSWNTAAGGTGSTITGLTRADTATLNPAILVDHDAVTTFYAQWQAKTYQVTYNLQGGNIGGDLSNIDDTLTFGQKYQDGSAWPGEDDAVILKTGYIFVGWYTTPDGPANGSMITGSMDVPHTLNENAATVYYAYWMPEGNTKYTVETYLQTADGTGYEAGPQQALYGVTGETAAVTGAFLGDPYYVFNGTHAGNLLSATILADGSMVLTLYYDRVKVKLNYNLNGGEGTGFDTTEHRWGEDVTVAAEPTRKGYAFSGWKLSPDDGLEATVNGNVITVGKTDTTVYAEWTPVKFDIELIANGVTIDPDYPVKIGDSYQTYDQLPTDVSIGDEWKFVGWSYDGVTMIDPNSPVATTNSPLYACFVRYYAVTYDANEGTITTENTETTQRKVWFNGTYGQGEGLQDKTLPAMPAATRDGYTFKYWYYIDKDTGKEVQVAADTLVTQLTNTDPRNPDPTNLSKAIAAQELGDDLVIYAKWEQNSTGGGTDIKDIIIPGVIGGAVGVIGTATILGGLGVVLALIALPVAFLLGRLFPDLELPDWLKPDNDPDDPDKPDDPVVDPDDDNGYVQPPKTGDNRTFICGIWLVMLLCGGGLTVLLRRRREEDEAMA